MHTLNENLFNRERPWLAAEALDTFFNSGGRCEFGQGINWIGIIFCCQMKANSIEGASNDLTQCLCWANMAIKMRESLATNLGDQNSWGTVKGAMLLRVAMIDKMRKFDDSVFSLKKAIDWCLGTPQVQSFISDGHIEKYSELEPEVKEVAEMLATLIVAKQIYFEGDVARLLKMITNEASQTNYNLFMEMWRIADSNH